MFRTFSKNLGTNTGQSTIFNALTKVVDCSESKWWPKCFVYYRVSKMFTIVQCCYNNKHTILFHPSPSPPTPLHRAGLPADGAQDATVDAGIPGLGDVSGLIPRPHSPTGSASGQSGGPHH